MLHLNEHNSHLLHCCTDGDTPAESRGRDVSHYEHGALSLASDPGRDWSLLGGEGEGGIPFDPRVDHFVTPDTQSRNILFF